jgi:hypothetical protein
MSILQKWLPKFVEKRAESMMLQIQKKSRKKPLHNFFGRFFSAFWVIIGR